VDRIILNYSSGHLNPEQAVRSVSSSLSICGNGNESACNPKQNNRINDIL